MNFIKRSFLSIKGRPIKSVLLLGILVLVSTVIMGAFIVKDASSNLEESIKNRLGAKARVKSDLDLLNNYSYTRDEVAKNQDAFIDIVSLLDSTKSIDGVVDVNYIIRGLSNTFSFVDVKDRNHDCYSFGDFSSCNSIEVQGFNNAKILDFDFIGYDLVEGRMPSQQEIDSGALVGVLGQPSSYQHGPKDPVKIGDTLKVKTQIVNQNDDALTYDFNEFEVEIVGFIETPELSASVPLLIPSSLFLNQFETVIAKERILNEDINIEPFSLLIPFIDSNTIYIKNSDVVNNVDIELKKLLENTSLSRANVRVITSSDEYHSIVGPVNNIKTLSSLLLFGTLFAGLTIISLILILLLRDRKGEIGIYLALGESYIKIVSQVIFEVMIIALIGIAVATYTSQSFAERLSSLMLENQRSSLSQSLADPLDLNNQEAILLEYQIEVDQKDYLVMYLIISGFILISIVPSCLYILKADPKKILM